MKNKLYKEILFLVLAIILGIAGFLYYQSRPIDKMKKAKMLDLAYSWFPLLSSHIVDFYQKGKYDTTDSNINKEFATYLVNLYKVDKTLSIPTSETPEGDFFYIYFLLPPKIQENTTEQLITYTNPIDAYTTPQKGDTLRCVIFLKNGKTRSTVIDESSFKKICPADVESKKPDLVYRDEEYDKIWEKLRK